MHTLSSARRTCMASASAVEWTATVWMPISRQARWMRSAISPRLAIRTFSNMAGGPGFGARPTRPDQRAGFAELDRLAVVDQDLRHRAGARGGIGFITFIASMISRVSPSPTLSPTCTNGAELGSGPT